MGNLISKPLGDLQEAVLPAIKASFAFLCLLQLATLALLALLLLATVALIISVNPDLIEERKLFVTPPIKLVLWQLGFVVGRQQKQLRGSSELDDSRSSCVAAQTKIDWLPNLSLLDIEKERVLWSEGGGELGYFGR